VSRLDERPAGVGRWFLLAVLLAVVAGIGGAAVLFAALAA
jgi:hypothetical protein